jgi:hypothetical protein
MKWVAPKKPTYSNKIIKKTGIVITELILMRVLTLFNAALTMLRFHQMWRLNESFHTFTLFLPINLTHRY